MIRTAVWGSPDDMKRLRPEGRFAPEDDEDYERDLAEDLASFGFVEVPRQ